MPRGEGWVVRRCYGVAAGFLVAFEGLDGAGTTTAANLFAERLEGLLGAGRVVVTAEPTRGPIGFFIRLGLEGYIPFLRRQDIAALLFAADRIYHFYEAPLAQNVKGIAGAMAAGLVVVTDRYKYSSIAYQAVNTGGSSVDMEWLWELNRYVPPPHVLVYIDVDPEEAAEKALDTVRKVGLIVPADRLAGDTA